MNNAEYLFQEAETLLQQGQLKTAADCIIKAREGNIGADQRFHSGIVLAGIWESLEQPQKSISLYRDLLKELDAEPAEHAEERALVLNNLGRLLLQKDAREALECFTKSCSIYTDLMGQNPAYALHLANSLMARAEAFASLKKYWEAKNDYKTAISHYQEHENEQSRLQTALAHYQLGGIYMEEFNAYDARTHYKKAIGKYLEGGATELLPQLPLLAACYNNIALAHKDLEDYEKSREAMQSALAAYKDLNDRDPETFAPYLAASFTHLAILNAEPFREFTEALRFNAEATRIYKELSEEHPDLYTHYLATAEHNAGVISAEARQWEAAEDHFERALQQRRLLEAREAGNFTADICSTALNLAEVYRHRLENPENWELREKALHLLNETQDLLAALDKSPVVENMKNDQEELVGHFRGLDLPDLHWRVTLDSIQTLESEIDGTLDLAEKKDYQQQILMNWQAFDRAFPTLERHWEEWARALNNMAWLHIMDAKPEKARPLLSRATQLAPSLLAIPCNLAHCDLLEGNSQAARHRYGELWDKPHRGDRLYGAVIRKDLKELVRRGHLKDEQLEGLPDTVAT